MKKVYLSLSVIFLVFSLIHNAVFADIQSGLIAYYPFDGNANDASGNNNHGSVKGTVSYTKGKFNQAASFDGNANGKDAIEVKSTTLDIIDDINQDWSVSVWFYTYVDYPDNSEGGLWCKLKGWADGFDSYLESGILNFNWSLYVSGEGYGRAKASFETKQWIHAIYVKSGTSLKLYKNGELANETIMNNFPLTKPLDYFYFGYRVYNNTFDNDLAKGSTFDGLIDEARIYDRALSAADVRELYQNTDLSSCAPSTIASNLDIYIASSDYVVSDSTVNFWVSLEYKGQDSDDDFVWRYIAHGINEPATCISSAIIAQNLDINILSADFETLGGALSLWVDLQFKGLDSDGDFLWKYVNHGLEGEPKEYHIADYFPMKKDQSKIYYEVYFDEDDNEVDTDWVKISYSEPTTFNGQSVVQWKTQYGDNSSDFESPDIGYISLNKLGLLVWGFQDDGYSITFPEPIQITSKKMSIGQSWETQFNLDGERITARFEFIAAGETVKTSYNNYTDTIRLRENTDGYERDIWLAKGVGIVKIDSVGEGDGGIFGYGDMDLRSIR